MAASHARPTLPQEILLRHPRLRAPTLPLAALLVSLAGRTAPADERFFTYSYEPKVLPLGALEFEQWTTAKVGKDDGVYSRWDLRSEIEYGLTESLTTALYLNFRYTHEDRDDVQEDEFEFKGISSEWKYRFTDPTADALGTMAYFEVTTNFEEVELEEKLILGKNLGRFVLAFNAIAEQEWEFENEGTEDALKLEFTAGAAYSITQSFSAGIEVREVNVFPDMDDLEHAALFVGPVVRYATKRWWITLTVLPQLVALKDPEDDSLNLDEFTRAEVRLILGIHF